MSSIVADKWVTRNHDEKLLPGLGKYSQRQMFWISAANVWCAKYRDKALKLRVLTGVHSPDMFRDDRLSEEHTTISQFRRTGYKN